MRLIMHLWIAQSLGILRGIANEHNFTKRVYIAELNSYFMIMIEYFFFRFVSFFFQQSCSFLIILRHEVDEVNEDKSSKPIPNQLKTEIENFFSCFFSFFHKAAAFSFLKEIRSDLEIKTKSKFTS